MYVSQGGNQLPEHMPRGPLAELLALVDEPKQLTVLLNLHDVVENSLHLAVS